METSNKIPTKTYQRSSKLNEPISISRCGEIPVEFESVCRLCLQKADYMSEIFKDDSVVPTAMKIRNLLGLRVQEEDDLPSLICGNCLVGLNEFYSFKKRCIANDVKLRQFLIKMPPKYQMPTYNRSAHNLNLVEDTSIRKIKKNDCTISWDDQVPMASIIITEYENSNGKLSNTLRKRSLGGKNATENQGEKTSTILEDNYDEMPLAQRLAVEDKNNKSKHKKLGKMAYSKVKIRGCSKKKPACREDKKHCCFFYKYKCRECSKTFLSFSLLKRHFRVHSGERPFACASCGLAFSQKDTLKRHVLQIHDNIRPFKCEYCSKSYSLPYLLTTHIKVSHTVKPKFRCTHCPKVFTHSSGLSRHKNVHKGAQYICSTCYRKFTDPSSVRRHLKIMHGVV